MAYVPAPNETNLYKIVLAIRSLASDLINVAGNVLGPASATDGNVVKFDGATGKLIKDSGLTLAGTNTGDQTITLTGDVTGSGTGSFAATHIQTQCAPTTSLSLAASGCLIVVRKYVLPTAGTIRASGPPGIVLATNAILKIM